MSRKDIRQLIRRLKKQGCTAVLSRSGRWRVTAPNGTTVTMAATPSDRRSVAAARRDARKKLDADL